MHTHNRYPKESGIYKLTCLDNEKIYIGKSSNIRNRLIKHKHSGKQSTGKCYLQNAIIKYGWDSFKVEILETVENFNLLNDNDSLLEREAYYIDLFNSTDKNKGYNRCKFSKDRTGIPVSDETKAKISKTLLGRGLTEEHKANMRQPRTEEHKNNIRLALLGKKHSEERKANKTYRTHSEETKEKIRQAKFGKPLSEETKAKMRKPKSEETKAKMRKRTHSKETKEKIKQTKLRQGQLKIKYNNDIAT